MLSPFFFLFFFNDTATTEIYTLSLHDALPILGSLEASAAPNPLCNQKECTAKNRCRGSQVLSHRSEEHTSELQSLAYLVCRLLLEKKKHPDRTRHDQHLILRLPQERERRFCLR